MLSREDNELLTKIGPGHADGRAHAALLDPGAVLAPAARARRPAGAREAARREAGRVPRHARPRRPARRALPASHRVAVLRAQRRMRPALRLSRLEIRCRGQLRRSAERALGQGFQAQDQDHGLPLHRARRPGLGLYGAAGAEARFPDIEWTAVPDSHRYVTRHRAGMQLAAGARRRLRYQPSELPAPRHGSQSRRAADRDPDALRSGAGGFRLRSRAPAATCPTATAR